MTTTTETTAELEMARVADEGRRAAEQLAARQQARQQARGAALVAAQAEWDASLCSRAEGLDLELADQRRSAMEDLQGAVEVADLGRALDSWRAEASARHAQRTLHEQWRQAHGRCGVGPTPPAPSLRTAEADEAGRFLVALDRAAARSAELAAEVLAAELVGERPTAPAEELPPGPAEDLEHAPGCRGERVELATAPVGHYSQGEVMRCLDCTASVVVYQPPEEPEAVAARAKAAPVEVVRAAPPPLVDILGRGLGGRS